MMARSITFGFGLLVLGPGEDSLLGQRIYFSQQASTGFDPGGSSPLVTAIFLRPSAHLSSLVIPNAIQALFTLLTASQNPAGVGFSAHTTAVGFTAFSLHQVERARDHRLGAHELIENGGQGRVGPTDLLAQFGGVDAQSVLIYILYNTDCQEKNDLRVKKWSGKIGATRTTSPARLPSTPSPLSESQLRPLVMPALAGGPIRLKGIEDVNCPFNI